MRIAVIGASGWLGGAITREALARGHEVTAMARHGDRLEALKGVRPVTLDASDPNALKPAIAGHDIVVASVTDRSTPDRSVIPAVARALIEATAGSDVKRIAWVGGGGSLEAPGGGRFVDQPGFPAEHRAEAQAQSDALELFRGAPETLDWTFLSPPPANLENGAQRGGYRTEGGDRPVTDAQGRSSITSGDLAAAMVDELEQGRYSRQRFTVGY